ncbi:NAD-dependent epimerase/dehydratase family protein [Roseovarius tolerans]|nr:NAD-dependent epimerase/dehydratase family protein [Roseovarius tolerans]
MQGAAPASRCLITGATGRLGRLLRALWPAEDSPQPIWLARRGDADILWPGADAPLPDLPPCATVVALWGQTSGDAQTLAQNVGLVAQGVRLAHACGAKRVFHISTAAIYGPGRAMHETRSPTPINAYGSAKLEMERAIAALPRDGLRHVILRLANVVGSDSLAPALQHPERGITLDRFADGAGPRRSYIAPGDLARVLAGLARLAPDTLPDTLNIAAPAPVAMEDLAQAAGCQVIWRAAPPEAQAEVSLDTARLARLLPDALHHVTPREMLADWHSAQGRIA